MSLHHRMAGNAGRGSGTGRSAPGAGRGIYRRGGESVGNASNASRVFQQTGMHFGGGGLSWNMNDEGWQNRRQGRGAVGRGLEARAGPGVQGRSQRAHPQLSAVSSVMGTSTAEETLYQQEVSSAVLWPVTGRLLRPRGKRPPVVGGRKPGTTVRRPSAGLSGFFLFFPR